MVVRSAIDTFFDECYVDFYDFSSKGDCFTMKNILCILLCALCFCGCSNTQVQPQKQELEAMDTHMTFTAYGPHAKEALQAATNDVTRLDALLSISHPTSEIKALNTDKSALLSKDTTYLLRRALEISADTAGAFDPTVAPLMDAWGFRSKHYQVPDALTIQRLLSTVDASAVQLSKDGHCTMPAHTQVDLGGIAKGYSADCVIQTFKDHGVKHGLISLGGNVQTLGSKPDGSPWRIGIQDPLDVNGMFATLEVYECAVVTSGGYLRYFEKDGVRYHHLIDPHTGTPANKGLLSVTIVTQDGTLADALSTALFVMGKEDAIRYWQAHKNDFDCILVTDDAQVLVTPHIANALTLSDGGQPEVLS